MNSCWDIKFSSTITCDDVEAIIKRNRNKEQLKNYTSLVCKIIAGGVVVGGTITGCIFLSRISPLGAAFLAGGVGLTVSGLKLITYTVKIPPFNKFMTVSAEEKPKKVNIKHNSYINFLKRAAKKLASNTEEFKSFRKIHKSELCLKDYYHVFIEVLIDKNINDCCIDKFFKKATIDDPQLAENAKKNIELKGKLRLRKDETKESG